MAGVPATLFPGEHPGGRRPHVLPIAHNEPITEKGGAAMDLDPAIRLTGFSHGAG